MRFVTATTAALITFAAFCAALQNQFVALDDFAYVVNNPHISRLNLGTLWWAFSSFHEGNWHPVTMLSLAIDRRIWGINPFGFHLTNIVLHSSLVFFFCLLCLSLLKHFKWAAPSGQVSSRTTSPVVLAAAFVSSLFFGLHPLRVESVAWVSERKDVLCLLFFVLSLLFYLRYCNLQPKPERIFPCVHGFWISFLFACLAIMSKPAAVSLPLVLLILDWYPLGRINDKGAFIAALREKTSFVLLMVAGLVLTLFAQKVAMDSAPTIGFTSRLLVGCKALLFYLLKTVWPTNLAAFYIHPGNIVFSDPGEYLLYALCVAAAAICLFFAGKKWPILHAIGLYYIVTLAPMLGIIQVGGQWAADRYSYLPSLGLAVVWGTCSTRAVAWMWRTRLKTLACTCTVLIIVHLSLLAVMTRRQIGMWHDTEALATRIIELIPQRSGAAYLARAIYRNEIGKNDAALDDITEALKIALRGGLKSTYTELGRAHAHILYDLGRLQEALAAADWAVETSQQPVGKEFLAFRADLARRVAGAARANAGAMSSRGN